MGEVIQQYKQKEFENKYKPVSRSKLGCLKDDVSSNSKFINNYSKQMKRIKQKSSHTFCDLSRISLILSKESASSSKLQVSHIKNKFNKGKSIAFYRTILIIKLKQIILINHTVARL